MKDGGGKYYGCFLIWTFGRRKQRHLSKESAGGQNDESEKKKTEPVNRMFVDCRNADGYLFGSNQQYPSSR